MRNLYISTFVTGILSIGMRFGFGVFTGGGSTAGSMDFLQANANSDYICIKQVTGGTCDITSCQDWKKSSNGDGGYQICEGTRVTSVAYYHLRTSCEAGYTNGGTIGDRGGDSGRHSSDFVRDSEACTITRFDNVRPVGVAEQD